MKMYFMRYGILILFMLVVFYPSGLAQSNSVEESNYDCEQQPLGLFRQMTGSTLKLSENYYDNIALNKEFDLKENRLTLDVLDEVDPAYKFYLIRNPSKSGKENCGAIMEVIGKLISPTGKVFDFKQATYDIPLRKLKFITIERDDIKYEVEAQFYAYPKFVKGMFEKGTLILKASGKNLGIVSMEFSFTSWNFE